jgi:hypothetical protein
MVWGESMALSTMVMKAVSAPTAAGVKCPWMEQLAPAARIDPQLLAKMNEPALAPLTLMLGMDSADAPVFVKVTPCDWLANPTSQVPNDKLEDDSDTVEL